MKQLLFKLDCSSGKVKGRVHQVINGITFNTNYVPLSKLIPNVGKCKLFYSIINCSSDIELPKPNFTAATLTSQYDEFYDGHDDYEIDLVTIKSDKTYNLLDELTNKTGKLLYIAIV